MPPYGDIQASFLDERDRLLQALDRPENRGVSLRLIGALAFRTHCPTFGRLQDDLGRVFTDIDFGAYSRDFGAIQRILSKAGYEEDKMVTRLFGEGRLLFHDAVNGRHIDVFLDRLDFCHIIPFKDRLEADRPTLPLAELLLEKMQIVHLNQKDVVDTIVLLREHEVREGDHETINRTVITRLAASDWGLWRTVTGNLSVIDARLEDYPQLGAEDRRVVRHRLQALADAIEAEPKTKRWRLRGIVGERIQWYKDVEELVR